MKKIKLYSKDNTVSFKLTQLECNKKLYNRLLEGIQLLGEFDNKVEVELYETKKNDQEEKTLVCCTDKNSDLVMLYTDSTDKKDYYKLIKVTYDGKKEYDLSLAKKFELTKENIELTRTKIVCSFKYGRLITDEETFYTIFLGDDIAYKIEINNPSKGINASNIVKSLNSLETIPNLMSFTDVFSKQNIEFESVTAEAYKDFMITASYTIGTGIYKDEQK